MCITNRLGLTQSRKESGAILPGDLWDYHKTRESPEELREVANEEQSCSHTRRTSKSVPPRHILHCILVVTNVGPFPAFTNSPGL